MLSSPSTDLDVQVKKIFGIISYVILNKIVKKGMTGSKKRCSIRWARDNERRGAYWT
jgi:hypothetical protein